VSCKAAAGTAIKFDTAWTAFMIWVFVVPMILGGAILLLDRFTARAADNSPRLDPNKCHRCGSITRYHYVTICDGCSSVVAVDLRAVAHPNETGRSDPPPLKNQTKRV
jgi:hypothetical protein